MVCPKLPIYCAKRSKCMNIYSFNLRNHKLSTGVSTTHVDH